MLHMIAALSVVFLFLTFGCVYFLKLDRMEEGREKDLYTLHLVQRRLRRILTASGVSYEIEGAENIPENEAVMFVGNHRSFFDIVIGYTLVKGPTGFISKQEVGKVPPLKRWMEELHCLFMDRDNIRQNLKVILEAIKLVKGGVSIWIYPEGKRSTGSDVKELLPFKEGSFKIAEKSGCRIVPIAMYPTRRILEEHFPRIIPTHVLVKVGEPILLSELPEEKRRRIGEYTREKIIGYLREMEARYGTR